MTKLFDTTQQKKSSYIVIEATSNKTYSTHFQKYYKKNSKNVTQFGISINISVSLKEFKAKIVLLFLLGLF